MPNFDKQFAMRLETWKYYKNCYFTPLRYKMSWNISGEINKTLCTCGRYILLRYITGQVLDI